MSECCPGGACEPRPDPNRRDFLKVVSAAGAAAFAGPFVREGSQDGIEHFVPVDKKLDPAWVKALFERAEPTVYRGRALDAIGMPCCGIGTGELYVLGDGRLGRWDLFNAFRNTGYGSKNYEFEMPASPVEHGHRLVVRKADGSTIERTLDRAGFPAVSFVGQYPIATITYDDPQFPVKAVAEVFSPFLPLRAADSGLPVTAYRWTLVNKTDRPISVSLEFRVAHAAHGRSASEAGHAAAGDVLREDGGVLPFAAARLFSARPKDGPPKREARVLADFEGEDYGDWKAEGAAIGSRPARGTLQHQQRVTGFEGRGLVNSYAGDDDARGKLTSPEFVVDRKWLNALVGGGRGAQTQMRLVVDGATVAAVAGDNDERLTWRRMNVAAWEGKRAHIEIVDDAVGPWGHVNVDHIELSDEPRFAGGGPESAPDWGELAVIAAGAGAKPDARADAAGGAAVVEAALTAKAESSVWTALAWRFPNHSRGRAYAVRYPDLSAVVRDVVPRLEDLYADTAGWRDAYYGGTLPNWLLERLHAPVANLATSLVEWRADGRFWAWEGTGCCEGTCTHVWNYAHALARLFPELERNVRERQDLGEAFEESSGLVGFRGDRNYAADGQCGTILKAYREHLHSADDAFLKRLWPRIKKALEFLMTQDSDADGVIENRQHNTYDINFYGANTFVGALYLAALRAGEEMAKLTGDAPFADRCRSLFTKGSAAHMRRLFDGEYFTQEADLAKHPEDQYGRGCLADQLFGQGWAMQLGLGLLYPRDAVQKSLRAIYKYNWAPDVGPQNARHAPERYFARRGEAGLFVCTWPKSAYLKRGVRYREEVWTGCEYQLAGHMLWEGMATEALAVIRGVHERYDGVKHNPWNEVECGDHYARAMASWGCYLAVLGFSYDGPRGVIGFDPRLGRDDFKAAFTAADGWGSYSQVEASGAWAGVIDLEWGRLRVREWRGRAEGIREGAVASVVLDGVALPHVYSRYGDEWSLRLNEDVVLTPHRRLKASLA